MLEPFSKVCDAVAFAHSRGVLHLGYQAENIIMEDFGTVYLMAGAGATERADRESGDGVSLSPEAAGGVGLGLVGSPPICRRSRPKVRRPGQRAH